MDGSCPAPTLLAAWTTCSQVCYCHLSQPNDGLHWNISVATVPSTWTDQRVLYTCNSTMFSFSLSSSGTWDTLAKSDILVLSSKVQLTCRRVWALLITLICPWDSLRLERLSRTCSSAFALSRVVGQTYDVCTSLDHDSIPTLCMIWLHQLG